MHFRMDWRHITFDWNRARAFLATAEEGSLSAASRVLGQAQPTLGRQVAALEEELGLALFERAGRGLTLTPAGHELAEHVRAMAEAAERVALSASGRSETVDGDITLTASEVYSAFLLPPVLARLAQLHPGIRVEVLASNTATDLLRRDADIAVRSFRPTEPELIARRLRDDRAWLYATPGYLDTIGRLRAPGDICRARILGFDRAPVMIDGLRRMGLDVGEANFPLVTANHLVQWEMVKAGLGLGMMPEEIGDAEPRVVRALPAMQPFPVQNWLTAHRDLATSARVRVVFDLVAGMLA